MYLIKQRIRAHLFVNFALYKYLIIIIILNPDKTTYTLFTPYPAEYTSNLDLTINNKALPMATHPKVLGLTLDPILTYSTHINNISIHAHKPLQIIKAPHTRHTSYLQLHPHTHHIVTHGFVEDPAGMVELLVRWMDKLAGRPEAG